MRTSAKTKRMNFTHCKPLRTLAFFVLLFSAFNAQAQDNPGYDKALADSLGGDDFGMKRYVLAILKTGPSTITDKAVVDSLFRGHMANIGSMAAAGKLMVAGPLQKNDRAYRGICILNVKDIDEARALLNADPALKAGLLDVEYFSWYGSAALPMYLPYHDKVQKKRM
jgi:uncharacterized protein YciI